MPPKWLTVTVAVLFMFGMAMIILIRAMMH
jgi:hypothetical protein